MSVVYVVTTSIPEDGENATVDQLRRRARWDINDYVYRDLILSGMFDLLFDIYQNVESSKELWDSLEAKYMPVDASNFKHTLKHRKEELTLVDLGSHLRIEESLKVQDSDKPKGNNVASPSVVNMVEHNNSSRHLKKDCKGEKIGNKANGSGITGLVNGSSNSLKVQNMFNKSLQDDDVAWWVDSGATVYVCKDRCWFKTYESLNDGSILHVGNESTALHARLGHVYYKRMQDMSKDGLISAFDMDTKNDLCDLHATLSLRNKNYFVTFINDALRFYVIEPNESVLINSIIESMDAIFDENRFLLVPRPSLRIPNETEDIGGSMVPKEDDPKIFDEAMKSQDVAFWKEVANLLVANGSLKENLSGTYQYHKTVDCYGINSQSDYSSDGCEDSFLDCYFDSFDILSDLLSVLITPLIFTDIPFDLIFAIMILLILGAYGSILVSTPMDTSEKLMPNNWSGLGKLSRYTSNPSTQHWQAIQRVFLLGGDSISWASKKQTCITGSIMKSEFVALAAAGKKAKWLRNLILEIPLWSKPIAPISILCDSVATLAKAYSQM
ncbi:hypothetical protein Tco_1106198 [Tanacetum coccineum]